MSNGVLSQEEIDALLIGDEDKNPSSEVDDENTLTELEKDVVGEIANIAMGTAATTLSTLLGKKVDITAPRVNITNKEEIQKQYPASHVLVDVRYTDGLQGTNVLILKEKDVAVIVDLMMGGDGTAPPAEMSELHLSAISEAMNQMMGSAATSMSTMLKKKIDISPPSLNLIDLSQQEMSQPPGGTNEPLAKVSFRMVIEDLVDSEMMQIMPIPFSQSMAAFLIGDIGKESPSPSPSPSPKEPEGVMGSTPLTVPTGVGGKTPKPSVPVQPVQFSPLQANVSKEVGNIELIMDIPLQITVELGKARKTIRDILNLGVGSVIELDKLAGEPVDLLVNGKLLAKGEVVVIDENFGVRITDIIQPIERVANLQ